MRPIKKGSTDQSVVIRIIDSSDGTPETGVDYDTAGIDLWYRREGATKTSITEAALGSLDAAHSDGGIEHIADGYYRLDLPDAAVAAGADGVMVGGTVTGMIVIGVYVPLVDYDPYDSVRMGMTALPNAAADAAGGLPISDAGGLDLDAQIGTDIDELVSRLTAARAGYLDNLNGHTPQTGDNYARLGAPSGASVSADIAAVKTDTGNLVTRITATLFSGITSLAEWLGLIAGKQSGDATARTEIRATGAGSGTFDETTDSLEALRDTEPHGTAMRGTDSAALASVCTETRLAELDSGNMPSDIDLIKQTVTSLGLVSSAIGVIASSSNVTTGSETGTYANTEAPDETYYVVTESGGTIDFYLEFELPDDSAPAKVSAKGRVDEGSVPSGGDTVAWYAYHWEESHWDYLGESEGVHNSDPSDDVAMIAQLFSHHVGTGANDGKVRIRFHGTSLESGTAVYLDQVHVDYGLAMSYTGLADAVWDEATSGHTDAGSFGKAVLDILDDTDDIGAAGAGLTAIPWNASWNAEVQSECTDALNAYDPPTKAELDTAESNIRGADSDDLKAISDQVDGLNDLSAADVNAQVLDVLNTDTFAEPGQEAPPATTTLVKKIGYLYKFLRNKIVTDSSTIEVYNDAGDTVDHKSSISDDGTDFTRGEFGSGP